MNFEKHVWGIIITEIQDYQRLYKDSRNESKTKHLKGAGNIDFFQL